MSTITEKLQTIKDSTMDIKQAIIDKGGEVGDLTTYADAIANLPSGGGDPNPTAEKNAVTFYDYDGTIRYSYTAEEFLALAEMPPLPTQKGLICQEWNWSIEDAKEYVAEYGVLDVGATYITDDGKTRLYIRADADKVSVPLYFSQTLANGVTIDWGDGSATQTLSGTGNKNTTHTYAHAGNYCISLDVNLNCTLGLGHGSSSYCVMGAANNNGRRYTNMLQKVEFGKNINNIAAYAFYLCTSLKYVVLPNTITRIYGNAFNRHFSLRMVVFPSTISIIDDYAFAYCQVARFCLSGNQATLTGSYIFQFCQTLPTLIIPSSMSTIPTEFFSKCYALSSVIIPKSVTAINGQAFYDCWGLRYCDFSKHTSVPTLQGSKCFYNTPDDFKVIVPDTLYSSWTAATNWSSIKSKIIKKSDWDAL
jgi:hypothetical protein